MGDSMAGSWRLAKSLETLRSQVNAAYPNRSKVSDGTIGDAAHASSASDHNPNPNGVVTALDLTHDPANGFDAHKLAEHLRTHRHPNLRYVISNERIAGAWTNWEWARSLGHTQHIHVSVGNSGVADGKTTYNYDSTQPWDINLQGGEMIADTDANYKMWSKLRKLVLGGGLTRTDFRKAYVGKSYRSRLDGIVNHSQAGAPQRELEEQLQEAQDALKQCNATLDQAKLQYDIKGDLQKQIEASGDKNDQLIAEIDKLKTDKAEADKVGNAFVAWLGEQLNKVLRR